MSSPAPRNRRAKLAVVRRSERITPHMIRLVQLGQVECMGGPPCVDSLYALKS